MAGVFVNYRSDDGDWAGLVIARELTTRFGAERVFYASRTIRIGEDFAAEIVRYLVDADVLLAVIGRRWLTSGRLNDPEDWVRREIALAFDNDVRVVPVLLDHVRCPREEELPEEIAKLARCQYLRLHHRNDDRDIARLVEELTEFVPDLATPALPVEDGDPACPYRGLQAFREVDAQYFHGRDREAARLTELAERHPVVVVVGGSGSGKSSLVRAGLLARLDGVDVISFRPVAGEAAWQLLFKALRPKLGGDWVDAHRDLEPPALVEAVADALGRAVLFVDQFEELIVNDPGGARELFATLVALTRAAARPDETPALRVVITLRSTDLEEVLTDDLTQVLEQASVYVHRMGDDQLVAAIKEPAAQVGWEFEAGLVERIVADSRQAAGQLALVEFTLTRLWESEQAKTLTHQAYDKIGGVAGALAGYATWVLGQLSPDKRKLARRLLTRLAFPLPDGGFALTPVRLDELDDDLRAIAGELSTSRLVIIRQDVGQPEVVALAHEALLHAWTELREWLTDSRAFRVWQEQLRANTSQWLGSGRDTAMLLRGSALATAEDWLTARGRDVSPDENTFIRASRKLRDRGRNRLYAVLALITALAVVAVNFALVARKNGAEAEQQARIATSRALLAQASAVSATQPRQSLMLSLAARRANPTREAHANLVTTLLGTNYAGVLPTGDLNSDTVRYHPNGRVIAIAGHDAVEFWDLDHRRALARLPGRSAPLAFSPDGSTLLTDTVLWDVTDLTHPARLANLLGTDEPYTAKFTPDGRTLLVAGGGYLSTWNVADRTRPVELANTDVLGVDAFSLDASTALVSGYDFDAGIMDLSDPGRPVLRSTFSLQHNSPWRAAFNRDGTVLAIVLENSTSVALWNVRDRTRPAKAGAVAEQSSYISDVAFSPGYDLLATTSERTSKLWNVQEPAQPVVYAQLSGQQEYPRGMAFNSKGDELATVGPTQVMFWRSGTRSPYILGRTTNAASSNATAVDLSDDGKTLVYVSEGQALVLDVTDPANGPVASTVADALTAALSRDGRILATADRTGKIQVYDITDRSHPTLTGSVDSGLNTYATDPPSLAFSPDGRTLAAGTARHIVLWDLTNRSHPVELTSLPAGGPEENGRGLVFARDSRTLFTALTHSAVTVWDIRDRTHAVRRGVLASGYGMSGLSLSADGRLLAGSTGGSVTLWDVSDRPRKVATVISQENERPRVALSPDGHILATATDQRVRLWDITDPGAPVHLTDLVSTGTIEDLAFSQDGRYLVTGSGGTTAVIIWNTGPLTEVVAHSEELACALVRPVPPRRDWDVDLPDLSFDEHIC